MMHSPVLKTIGMVTWVITALVSINMLTGLYDYDFLSYIMEMMPGMTKPILWVIGISGFVSLAMLIKAVFMCCPGCGSCPCNCNKAM